MFNYFLIASVVVMVALMSANAATHKTAAATKSLFKSMPQALDPKHAEVVRKIASANIRQHAALNAKRSDLTESFTIRAQSRFELSQKNAKAGDGNLKALRGKLNGRTWTTLNYNYTNPDNSTLGSTGGGGGGGGGGGDNHDPMDQFLTQTVYSKKGKNLEKNKKRCRDTSKLDKKTNMPKNDQISFQMSLKLGCSPMTFETEIADGQVTYTYGSVAKGVIEDEADKTFEFKEAAWYNSTVCDGEPDYEETVGTADECENIGTQREPEFAKIAHGPAKVASSFSIGYYDDSTACESFPPTYTSMGELEHKWWDLNSASTIPRNAWPDHVVSYQMGGCMNDWDSKTSMTFSSCSYFNNTFLATMKVFNATKCKSKNLMQAMTVDLANMFYPDSLHTDVNGCHSANATFYDDQDDDGVGHPGAEFFRVACIM